LKPSKPGFLSPKFPYFALTAINQVAASYYFNYLFFLLRDRFGFGDRQNLAVAALHGGLYTIAAWQCGRFAERRGFHTSLKVGFGGLTIVMIAGAFVTSWPLELLVLACYTGTLLFTWPALEALAIQHEPPSRVPHLVGVYNCTWSAAAAFSYFTGGALYDRLGKGAVFWIPAVIFASEFVFMMALAKRGEHRSPDHQIARSPDRRSPNHQISRSPDASITSSPQTFLRLAWLANPLSYVAVNTLLAVMPGLGQRLGLSAAAVGLLCSIWFFARLTAFAVLWQWTAWHYRFRWLVGGYVALAGSFLLMLIVPSLAVLAMAQVPFGLACGLMYNSSLFYAMDVGEAKAEHGGLHEAAIGAGVFAGPAVGALSLQLFPAHPDAGPIAVTGLLGLGLAGLLAIWRGGRRRERAESPLTRSVR